MANANGISLSVENFSVQNKMQRFLELFCCNFNPPPRDNENRFDSGLLAPSMLTMGSSNRGHTTTISYYEDEEIIQNIFDVFAHITDPSAAQMEKLLCTALEQIKEPSIRMVIVSNLLESNRQHAKTNEHMLEYVLSLVSPLDDKHRKDLTTVILDLPAAVLGDAVAREHSRVLIDLNADVKESMKEDKHRIAKKKKIVDTITEMLQQSLAQLTPAERDQATIYIFSQQPQPLMLKTVMQQLFMSRLVSASVTSREELLQHFATCR